MLFIAHVKEQFHTELGTARVETVRKEINKKFHKLIKSFDRETSIPILLNTSLNTKCVPIVESSASWHCTSDYDRKVPFACTAIHNVHPWPNSSTVVQSNIHYLLCPWFPERPRRLIVPWACDEFWQSAESPHCAQTVAVRPCCKMAI